MDHIKTVVLIALILLAGMWINKKWPGVLAMVPVIGG